MRSGGSARLRDFLALHRAAAVQHDHDIARDALARVERRGEQQREVAVLLAAGLAMREQAGGDETLAAREVQPEVTLGRPAFGRLPQDAEVAWTVARHRRNVARSASAVRTSQGTSIFALSEAAAGRGDMRDQGASISTSPASAVSGVVTV